MTNANQGTRNMLLVLLLLASLEIFRPAPAMTQRSVEDYMHDVVYELRGIRQELGQIEGKMK